MNSVLRFLEAHRQRLQLDQRAVPRRLSCCLVTPRFRTSRHVIFLITPAAQAEPVLVAKLPRLPGDSAGIEREADSLRTLARRCPQGSGSFPELVAFEEHQGEWLLLETGLVGRVLDAAAVRRDLSAVCSAVVDWLVMLGRAGTNERDEAGSLARLVERPLDEIATAFSPRGEEAELVRRTLELARPLAETEFPLVFEHGDLCHPNLLLLPDGRLGVLDWELADPHGLPACDLFFFLAFAATAQSRAKTLDEQRRAFDRAFIGPQAWSARLVDDYAEKVGVPREALGPLFLVTWARYVAGLLQRSGDLEEIHAAGGREWLRTNRYYQFWRHTLDHYHKLAWHTGGGRQRRPSRGTRGEGVGALQLAPRPTLAGTAPAGPTGMRILYLTNGFPYPLTSGYLRHYYLLRELGRRHAVTLCSLVNSAFVPEHAEALRPFTERIETFALPPKPPTWAGKARRRLDLLLSRTEALQQMRESIGRLVRAEEFDVVLASGKETLPVLESLAGLPLVVDICDAASVRVRGRMQYSPWRAAPGLLLEWARLRRTEQHLLAQGSHLLFASCRDREALADGRRPASVIPNGVDLDYWRRGTTQLGRDTIVFTGAMSYAPNTDAAVWLAGTIFRSVRQAVPHARLLLVGRDPPARLRALGELPGVTVTGWVDDVRPYLEQAAVFAAPLRFGAGIQNKLLEALAMELPVVATRLALDGLRTEQGEFPPATSASSAEEFAAALVAELTLRRHDPAPCRQARQFVARHFDWGQSGAKLDEVLRAVAGIPASEAVPCSA